MQTPPIPQNETERLQALRDLKLLDTPAEENFDSITRIASEICGVPVALVSLIDQDRQWFKAKHGIDIAETPREISFCGHAICAKDEIFTVTDAQKDPRFFDTPLVIGDANVRFYAGVPLHVDDDLAIGTLCVMDSQPRELSDSQIAALKALKQQVLSQFELRRHVKGLQQANQQLENLNQEKNEFMGILAHDLKNPLSIIKNLSEEIEEDLDALAADELQSMVHNIQQSSNKMTHLIMNLLDVHALEAGKMRSHLDEFDLRPHIEQSLAQYQPAAKRKQIQLLSDLTDVGNIQADSAHIGSVLDNLISNAIKYSPLNTQVSVRLYQQGDKIGFEVKDQGPGLSESDQKALFGKFQRLSAQPTGGEHSSGLGLYFVKKLVLLMQATIWCESHLGEGARFIVEFKVA